MSADRYQEINLTRVWKWTQNVYLCCYLNGGISSKFKIFKYRHRLQSSSLVNVQNFKSLMAIGVHTRETGGPGMQEDMCVSV